MPDEDMSETMELLCSNFKNRSSDDAFQSYVTMSFLSLFQYRIPETLKCGIALLVKYNINDHIVYLWKNCDRRLLKMFSYQQFISVVNVIESSLYAARLKRIHPIAVSALTVSEFIYKTAESVLTSNEVTSEIVSSVETAVYKMYMSFFKCVSGLKTPWSGSVSDQGIASSVLWNFISVAKLFCDKTSSAGMKKLWTFLTADTKVLASPPPPRYVQDVILRAFSRVDWSTWSPSSSDIEYILQILSCGNASPVLLELLCKITSDVPWESTELSKEPSFYSLFLRLLISLSYSHPSPNERVDFLVKMAWSINWEPLSPDDFKDILSACFAYINELEANSIEQSAKCYETIFIVKAVCGIRISCDLLTFKQADSISNKMALFVRFFCDVHLICKTFFATVFESIVDALLEVYMNSIADDRFAKDDIFPELPVEKVDAMGPCIMVLFRLLNHPVIAPALDHAIRNFLLKNSILVPRFIYFASRVVNSMDSLVAIVENYLNMYFFALSEWEPVSNALNVDDSCSFEEVALEKGAPLCLMSLM